MSYGPASAAQRNKSVNTKKTQNIKGQMEIEIIEREQEYVVEG